MFEVDINTALDYQRSNSKKIIELILAKNKFYVDSINGFFTEWLEQTLSVDSASEDGLKVLASLLDIQIFKDFKPVPKDLKTISLDRSDSNNFSGSVFGWNNDTVIEFTTEQKRIAIKLKAYSLVMHGSRTDINKNLCRIFGAGEVIYIDLENMNCNYIIQDIEKEKFILDLIELDLLPKPAGVNIAQVIVGGKNLIGFTDINKNFNRGIFNS